MENVAKSNKLATSHVNWGRNPVNGRSNIIWHFQGERERNEETKWSHWCHMGWIGDIVIWQTCYYKGGRTATGEPHAAFWVFECGSFDSYCFCEQWCGVVLRKMRCDTLSDVAGGKVRLRNFGLWKSLTSKKRLSTSNRMQNMSYGAYKAVISQKKVRQHLFWRKVLFIQT